MPDTDMPDTEAPPRAQLPRWFPMLTMTAMTILAVGLIALIAAVQDRMDSAPPTRTTDPPAVLFVGDSYSAAGYPGVSPQQAFPCATAARLGWRCLLDVQGATGYGTDGRSFNSAGKSYGERLPGTLQAYPDPAVVVVSGGRNDDPGQIGAAADLYLSALRDAYPAAKVYVLEPFWIGAPTPGITMARTAVATATQRVGATWVPTQDWLPDDTISADLVHPTLAGQQSITDHLTAVLENAP